MTILIKKKHPKLPVSTGQVRSFMKKTMLLLAMEDKEISVFFTDDEGISELNSLYLGKNCPTNVLSFPLLEDETTNETMNKTTGDKAADKAAVKAASGETTAGKAIDRVVGEMAGKVAVETAIGDIVVSVDTAQREAEQAEIALNDVIDSLLLHGLLHLAGYDHERVDKTRANQMLAKEKEIFFVIKGYYLER